MMQSQDLSGNLHNAFPDFFQVDGTDFNGRKFAQIDSDGDNYHIWTSNLTVLVQWETGNKAQTLTDTFCWNDKILFQLACVAFKDSSESVILSPRKGIIPHIGCQAFFACKGQFIGIKTA